MKYEKIFQAIKDEWDKMELNIIPYKENLDSYILINTDILSSVIEENLTTLETIQMSSYAKYIKEEILEQMTS